MKPGVPDSEPDAAARKALDAFGMRDLFVHHTGHGIGFRYHEAIPSVHPDSKGILQAGMITSLEPGLYGETFGYRVEDNVLITPGGGEALLPQPTLARIGGIALSMNETPLIEARAITKSFPGTLALDKVDFQLMPGEIHALVGENGAGKSTLMLVMAGVHQPDGGELLVSGQPVKIRDPHEAQELGISTVFQDLALAPMMSVAENVFTNSQPVNKVGFVRFQDMYKATAEALKDFDVKINPRTPLYLYNVAVQQIVEIARAIQRNAKILIFDEPTSAIGERETERLFNCLQQLKEQGVGIIYVSHKLDEVFAISDRITVLKDGKLVGTVKTAETNKDAIVHMMVGRELDRLFPQRDGGRREPVLEVRNLSGHHYSDINLTVHSGEILCLFGLTGSGRTELAQGIFGNEPVSSGRDPGMTTSQSRSGIRARPWSWAWPTSPKTASAMGCSLKNPCAITSSSPACAL